ncbi:kinase-like domain-containing protein [Chlamydoabsidia padenii]|nr:kinase-like domain-containing protein [Chlamydoabsidia padenii]
MSEHQTHVSFSPGLGYDSASSYNDDDMMTNGRRHDSFSDMVNTDYESNSFNNNSNNSNNNNNNNLGNNTYSSSNYGPPTTFDRSNDPYCGHNIPHNDINDQSTLPDSEKVIEVSPNERYIRLNTLLGKGAYKVVYKAIDREEGYEVAWNVIQAMRTPSNKELDHEIQILKSIRHPNIIALHDAWHTDNEFVFITELMTSGTLREYLKRLSLPNLKIVKRWSRQILKGLVYLHDHHPPIIHRDIKCDNIFINGAHGEVKIGDMGTAEMKMGKKYTLIGTPEFMAPEMYEEQGYSEKVDIYAFGMCLLEMATGEYPYGECTNAAQIYKKVSAGIKPACLAKVTNAEVLSVVENCIGPEDERLPAQDILEHPLLAVEPDVVLLATDLNHVHLTLQVVFKGMDKLSVKFDFNVETDTAEQVVREMIEEQVLPERYQQHITKEINRILRDMDKADESQQSSRRHDDDDDDDDGRPSIWRREKDIRSELEKTRLELQQLTDRAMEMEAKCEDSETRARVAESMYRDAMRSIRERQQQQQQQHDDLVHPTPVPPLSVAMADSLSGVSMESSLSHEGPRVTPEPNGYLYDGTDKSKDQDTGAPSDALVSHIVDEYGDDTDIELFVQDCAMAVHRSLEKAHEWTKKLQNQDIMTVGDLRDLHDEDWGGIGLTVFALRALKNMLKGKRLQAGHPKNTHSSPPATLSSSPPPQ